MAKKAHAAAVEQARLRGEKMRARSLDTEMKAVVSAGLPAQRNNPLRRYLSRDGWKVR